MGAINFFAHKLKDLFSEFKFHETLSFECHILPLKQDDKKSDSWDMEKANLAFLFLICNMTSSIGRCEFKRSFFSSIFAIHLLWKKVVSSILTDNYLLQKLISTNLLINSINYYSKIYFNWGISLFSSFYRL